MKRLPPHLIIRLISYWPPYLAAGIKVIHVDESMLSITTRLKQYPWNTNYFGTHFGGSLYAMCDPFYVFLLAHHLQHDFIIWDKAAEINFIKAVATPVTATFQITPDTLTEARNKTLKNFSITLPFVTQIVSSQGDIIAAVKKTIYIRRKDAKSRFTNPNKQK
tara:strand:+ start:255 stop:743 length:489 start_codon:yes stop_codon:yes gene_type:complete